MGKQLGLYHGAVEIDVSGRVIEWRGPAPYFFVEIDEDDAIVISELAGSLTYGWGCIPVRAQLHDVDFTTSLMPRAGGYVLPLKKAVREQTTVQVADKVELCLRVGA